MRVEQIKDESGEIVTQIADLTPEHYESLRALFTSPHWKLYHSILKQVKEAEMQKILPMDDPYKVMKQTGLIAGMNYSMNQLWVMIKQFDHANERREKEEKAQEAISKKPFRRG